MLIAAIDTRDILQSVVAGVGVGCIYALVALGFVVIYKATGVINFAQGSLVMLGAYLTYTLHNRGAKLPFYLSVVIAMLACAAVGLMIERLMLRRMVGQPVFAIIMITIGLTIMTDRIIEWLWGGDLLHMGDPWGAKIVTVSGVVIPHIQIARIAGAGGLLFGFFLFFRYSKMGVAMRATASDQEAALSMGISARRIFAVSWAIAAAVGALAGVLLASGGADVNLGLSLIALVAFPALILGGLDSPAGAVVGGLVIGMVEEMTKLWQASTTFPEAFGTNVHTVVAYMVLVIILMIRPHGFFGTKEVERV